MNALTKVVAVLLLAACGTVTAAEEPGQTGSIPGDPQTPLAGQGGAVDSEPRGTTAQAPGAPQANPVSRDEAGPPAAPVMADPGPSAGRGSEDPAPLDDDPGDPAPDTGSWPQVWVGYVENFSFWSGSDVVTLTFDELGPEGVIGRVMFGAGPAGDAPDPHSVLMTTYPRQVHEDYAYTLRETSFDGARLRVAAAPNELWDPYCASFPPIADEVNAGNFACTHNWPFTAMGTDDPNGCYLTNPDTGMNEPFDCAQLWFCNQILGVCTCDADACGAEDSATIRFDVRVEGDEMHGSVDGLSTLLNVHFERQ